MFYAFVFVMFVDGSTIGEAEHFATKADCKMATDTMRAALLDSARVMKFYVGPCIGFEAGSKT